MKKKDKPNYLLIKGRKVFAYGGNSIRVAKKRLKALLKDNGQLDRIDDYLIVEIIARYRVVD